MSSSKEPAGRQTVAGLWNVAVILLLTVFGLLFPAPANADDEIWSATLNAYGSWTESGCFSGTWADWSKRCENPEVLTDDDFSFAGTDYRIVNIRVWVSDSTLNLILDKLPADVAVEDLTLHVGENAFPFKNGRVLTSPRYLGVRWASSGLDYYPWAAGGDFALRITAPAATAPGVVQNLQAAPGNRKVVLTWTAPASNGGSRLLDYELRYSQGATVSSSAAWSSAGMDFTETISGLTKGQQYAFEVRARNRAGGGTAETATATLTANSIPRARDGTVTTPEDTKYTFQASDFNFTDADAGDVFASIEVVTLPPSMKGRLNLVDRAVTLLQVGDPVNVVGTSLTAVQAGDVVDKADIDAGKLTFAPAVDGNGSPYATFTFKVSDGFDYSTSASTMTINVGAVQDAPTAEDGTVTTTEDMAYTFQADDFNFADVDDGDAFSSVKVLTPPPSTKGTLTLDGDAVGAGRSVTAAGMAAGQLVFTPVANGNGDPYTSFTFKVSSGALESAGSATMTLDVTAVNDPATGKPSISGTARVGQKLKAATAEIADVDGMADVEFAYQWIRVTSGSDATITGATSSTYRLVAADLNNQIKVRVSFTDNDGTAEPARTSDAWPSGGTVLAQVGADQTLPALSVADATATKGETLSFQVMLMSVATEEVTVDYATSDGTATAGEDYTAASGTLTFAPGETEKTVTVATTSDDAEDDSETLTLTLSNPDWATLADATATGTVTEASTTGVNGNTLPTAADRTVTTPEDTDYNFEISEWGFSDEDEGDDLYYVSFVSLPAAETGILWRKPYSRSGWRQVGQEYFFRPAPNWHGHSTVRFRVSDSKNLSRRTYTMTINVTSVNDEATGRPTITGVRQVGQTLTASTAEIADADGLPNSLAYQWFRVDTDGTSNPVDGTSNPVAIPGANLSTYTLAAADLGKRVRVRVSFADRDGYSEQMTSDATGTVKAQSATNAAPTASDATVRTDEDTDYVFQAAEFGFADTDRGDALASVKVVTPPTAGALLLDGVALSAGAALLPDDIGAGKFAFRPARNAHGTAHARFTFKVSDGTAESASANTITIDVTPVNDPATGKLIVLWKSPNRDTQCCGDYWYVSTDRIADADGMTNATFSYKWIKIDPDDGESTAVDWWNISAFDSPADAEANKYKAQARFTDDDGNRETLVTDVVVLTRPTVTGISVSPPKNGIWSYFGHTGSPKVEVTLTFSEAVTVSGYPLIRLRLGASAGQNARYVWHKSGPTTLVFEYDLHGGDIRYDSMVVVANSLDLNNFGTIRSKARPSVDAALGHDGYDSSTDMAQVVDPPTVSDGPSVSAAGSDGAWAPDETVEVTLTFSEAVTVDTTDGTPSIGISLGGTEARSAAYLRGSGTAELVFGYTLVEADGSHTSMAVTPNSLALNGGTIRSTSIGVDATLSHIGKVVIAPPAQVGSRDQGQGEGAGFTARFASLPEHHDGATAFKFELHFSEAPVGLSYRTVQGGLLNVTGANVTHARRLTPGSNLGWEITAEPTQSGAIVIALPVRACDAANAVCLDGGTLAQAVSATVAGVPLTASFSQAPAEHDGTNAFELRFQLSTEPATISYVTVRDSLFEVTGGTIGNASRLVRNRNRGWKLKVAPSGFGDVTLRLKATTSCDAPPGVCTSDGRMLDGGLSVTVLGPVALSVADAEVDEAEGATLDFTVTLSRASGAAVTVDYATSDGTAAAGSDYTTTSGTLTFAAGATSKTVSVPVADDAHDEGSETMTLTLSNPSPARVKLADATATGTINNTDAMPKAWIVRFGRTVADQVLHAVEGRLEAPRAAGIEASLAGQAIGGAGPSDEASGEALERREAEDAMTALADWLRGETSEKEGAQGFESRAVTERDLLLGSSFALTGGSAESGFGALWGRAAVSGFDGRDGELTVDGEVTSAMVGADWTRGPATAGLTVAHSRGEGSYRSPGGDGEAESTLTGVYPYGRYALSERVSVWGVAGIGRGTLTLKPVTGAQIETDMALSMGALGLRGVLVEAPADGGVELSVKTDGMMVRTSSDAASGTGGSIAAAEADVTRLRLGLQATWHGMNTGGGILTPSVEIGVRHDGGDAETGFGADIGAGLTWSDPESGLSADIRARGLLAHEADGFSERGFSGTVSWDPEPSTALGPSLTLTQTIGAASSGGAEALLGRGTMEGLAPDDGGDELDQRHLEARLGYGFALFGGRFTGTPEIGLGLSDEHLDYSVGWRLGLARSERVSFELDLTATRREAASDDGAPEHGMGLRGTARW